MHECKTARTSLVDIEDAVQNIGTGLPACYIANARLERTTSVNICSKSKLGFTLKHCPSLSQ